MTLYHATWTALVPQIRKQGLKCGMPSNWGKASNPDSHYGDGDIHAFESKLDAIRWAAKMDWANNRTHGSGKVTILQLDNLDESGWTLDENDPLSQFGSWGRWLKTSKKVGKKHIGHGWAVSQDMIKLWMDEDRKRYASPSTA